jgi:hypothetical protein
MSNKLTKKWIDTITENNKRIVTALELIKPQDKEIAIFNRQLQDFINDSTTLISAMAEELRRRDEVYEEQLTKEKQ